MSEKDDKPSEKPPIWDDTSSGFYAIVKKTRARGAISSDEEAASTPVARIQPGPAKETGTGDVELVAVNRVPLAPEPGAQATGLPPTTDKLDHLLVGQQKLRARLFALASVLDGIDEQLNNMRMALERQQDLIGHLAMSVDKLYAEKRAQAANTPGKPDSWSPDR